MTDADCRTQNDSDVIIASDTPCTESRLIIIGSL